MDITKIVRVCWDSRSYCACVFITNMADLPISKKRKIDCEDSTDEDKMNNIVLALCGSFNPITFLHLRMFGKFNMTIE